MRILKTLSFRKMRETGSLVAIFLLLASPAWSDHKSGSASEGDDEKSNFSICVHPQDEAMGHFVNSCQGKMAGHAGVKLNDGNIVDLCAPCQTAHSANPNLCKVVEFQCRVAPPEAPQGDGYVPKVIRVGK